MALTTAKLAPKADTEFVPSDYGFLLGTSVFNPYNNWLVSNYLPVVPNCTYKTNLGTLGSTPATCFYDARQKFLRSVTGTTRNNIVVREGEHLVRVSFNISDFYTGELTQLTEPPAPDPIANLTVTTAMIDRLTTDNIVATVNGVAVVNGLEIFKGDILKLTATGRTFYNAGFGFSVTTGSPINFVLSVGNTVATLTFPDNELTPDDLSYTVTAYVAPVPVARFTVDAALLTRLTTDHIVLTVNGVDAVDSMAVYGGDVFKLVATGRTFYNAGFGFDLNTGLQLSFTLSEGNTVATITFPETDLVPDDLSYTATDYVAPLPPVAAGNYVITQTFFDSMAVNGVAIHTDGIARQVGFDIPIGASFQLVAPVTQPFEKVGGFSFITGIKFDFTLSAGSTIATMTKPFPSMAGDILDIPYTLFDPVVETDIQGANDVYAVTDEDIRSVIVNRYVYIDGMDSSGSNIYKDFGVFMLGFIRLPFAIDPLLVAYQDEIRLGNVDTGIIAGAITTDKFTYDMGSISVPSLRGDFLDFKNTEVLLHIPYGEPLKLDIDHVIGETLRIEYVVNGYDGVAKINIYSTKIDGLVMTHNLDLNIKIPFANVDDVTPSKNSAYNIELGGDNGILQPFVEVMRNDPIMPDGYYSTPIVDECILNTQKGYILVDKINLKTRASDAELLGIENLLNEGIYIK